MKRSATRWPVYFFAALEGLVIAASLTYALAGVLGRVQVTIPIYFFWLGLHYVVNCLLFLVFWERRAFFSLRARAIMLVWGGLVGMWYMPAAIFFVLTMNLSPMQVAWMNFVWMWELLGVGGILVGGFALLSLKKITDFLDKGTLVGDPSALYEYTLTIPIRIAASIIIVATFGYALAALQFHVFASHAPIEQVKLVAHGFVTSIFVALFYFHSFDQLLSEVRKKLELTHPIASTIRRKYSWRVVVTTALVGFGGLLYVTIAGAQLLQLYTRATVTNELLSKLAKVDTTADPSTIALSNLIMGEHTQAQLIRDASDISTALSPTTKDIIFSTQEGVVDDFTSQIKLIGFKTVGDQKLISVVYLSDFYTFGPLLLPFIAIFLFIMCLTVVVAIYASRFVTLALVGLSAAVKSVAPETQEFSFDTHTADELEDLSHSFSYFINESLRLKRDLLYQVEEKTRSLVAVRTNLEEQNANLEDTKRAMLNLLEDLEESKKLTEREKAKDDALLSSISEGMIATDRSGKINHVNKQAIELLGWSAHEALGTLHNKIFTIVDEKDQELPVNQNPIASDYGQERDMSSSAHTFFLRRKNLIKFPASIIVSPIKLTGQIVGKLVVFRDITLEREIDRMKSEFISLASHQLRTPLSAMKWYLEMLLTGDIGAITGPQRELIDNVNQSNERMISLVRSLLNVSRIESGRLIIDPRPTDMNEFIKSTLTEIQPRVFEKSLHLIVSYNRALPKISIDAKLIREVFINLLTNAIKYTPSGGEVTVFISRKNDELICQISDNGIGVPKDEQSRLFEKFFRASNVVKRETDGTGLGLYLAKIIMAASGGRIWYKSEEGRGTTFWFSLPISGTHPKEGEVSLDTALKI